MDATAVYQYIVTLTNPIQYSSIIQSEKSKFYLGVELETESKGNCRQSCAEEIDDISDLYYLKNDSSIDDGFEVVSHPFSHTWYYKNKSIFNDLLYTLRNNGFRSYNTSTCGIHIHITKSYLSGLDIAKTPFILLPERRIYSNNISTKSK